MIHFNRFLLLTRSPAQFTDIVVSYTIRTTNRINDSGASKVAYRAYMEREI